MCQHCCEHKNLELDGCNVRCKDCGKIWLDLEIKPIYPSYPVYVPSYPSYPSYPQHIYRWDTVTCSWKD